MKDQSETDFTVDMLNAKSTNTILKMVIVTLAPIIPGPLSERDLVDQLNVFLEIR